MAGGAAWRPAAHDGRFHFELDRSPSDFPDHDTIRPGTRRGSPPPPRATGRPRSPPKSLLEGGEATLQLVRDDVRNPWLVVDPQGRPVAGGTVRAYRIAAVNAGIDPGSLIAAGEFRDDRATSYYTDPTYLGRQGTCTDRRRRTI